MHMVLGIKNQFLNYFKLHFFKKFVNIVRPNVYYYCRSFGYNCVPIFRKWWQPMQIMVKQFKTIFVDHLFRINA